MAMGVVFGIGMGNTHLCVICSVVISIPEPNGTTGELTIVAKNHIMDLQMKNDTDQEAR
jgi:uncharacterized membrane protein